MCCTCITEDDVKSVSIFILLKPIKRNWFLCVRCICWHSNVDTRVCHKKIARDYLIELSWALFHFFNVVVDDFFLSFLVSQLLSVMTIKNWVFTSLPFSWISLFFQLSRQRFWRLYELLFVLLGGIIKGIWRRNQEFFLIEIQ